MTAFAFQQQRDKITIASDTLGYLPDQLEVKPRGFVMKCIPLTHLHCVIFSRGQKWIEAQAIADLQCAPGFRCIEDVAEAMPELLRHHTDRYGQVIGYDGNIGDLFVLDLALAGYSARDKRMRHYRWASHDDFVNNHVGDDDRRYGGTIYPWPHLPEKFLPHLTTAMTLPQQLTAMIRAIDAFYVAEPEMNHGQRVGGEVIVTEVTPTEIRQRSVYRFLNYDQVDVASAAVQARVLRGDIDDMEAVREGLTKRDDLRISATGELLRDAKPQSAQVTTLTPQPHLSRQERRAAERAARKARAA